MILLPGVRVVGLKPEILLAMMIVDGVYHDLGLPCRIKSVVDGNHSGGPYHTSSHYGGTSFDVAIPTAEEFAHPLGGQPTPTLTELSVLIAAHLGSEYFMAVNTAGSHIHISYMPQQP